MSETHKRKASIYLSEAIATELDEISTYLGKSINAIASEIVEVYLPTYVAQKSAETEKALANLTAKSRQLASPLHSSDLT